MVPRYVELRTELLPRTPSEKIAKEALRVQGIAGAWDRRRTAITFADLRSRRRYRPRALDQTNACGDFVALRRTPRLWWLSGVNP